MDRRTLLSLAGGAAFAGALKPKDSAAETIRLPGLDQTPPSGRRPRRGVIVGQVEGALAGQRIIADGGNAVDGIVAAALVAGVVDMSATGIAGYGGHMTIAMVGKPVVSIDLNSTAPASARHDMFDADEEGRVPGRVNEIGWLSAGVPGTLAGLQLAADRFGARPFRQLLLPAIEIAEEGFLLGPAARAVSRSLEFIRRDPGASELLLVEGQPPEPGTLFRNPRLAAMLETLANDNSVESFYKGPIARVIAEAFHRNGGLVTMSDLSTYEARVVEPLRMDWLGQSVYTAPLTAGGATMMQTLNILRALGSDGEALASAHTRLECLRVAWRDRLELFGDPEASDVPIERLLSDDYAAEAASSVSAAVRSRTPLDISTVSREQDGTIHLSAADPEGNMATITFTHGGSLGSRVVVPELGLILGHGVSRFDPRPGHPNSPGPGKRPLHNMCPTILVKDGKPWLACGGRGARRIPNATFDVVVGALQGKSMADAVAAPRMHTEGNLDLVLEESFSDDEVEALEAMGYEVRTGRSATISAAEIAPETGHMSVAHR